MLDSPIYRLGRLYGVIYHEHAGPPRVWREAGLDFAPYMAPWIALALEIEEQQRAGTALRESEERYRLVIAHAPTLTVVVDLQSGPFTDVNGSAESFSGADH